MTFRVVLDTNPLVSGFLWGGCPLEIVKLGRDKRLDLLSSTELLSELQTVLTRRKFERKFQDSALSPSKISEDYLQLLEIVSPVLIPNNVVRDPKNVRVLAAAVGGNATHIVSGDKDLLVLGRYESIPILSAGQFLTQFEAE